MRSARSRWSATASPGGPAAAMLKRRVPGVQVALVPLADPVPGLADLVATTGPTARDFHADMGLDDADIVARTRRRVAGRRADVGRG